MLHKSNYSMQNCYIYSLFASVTEVLPIETNKSIINNFD